MHDSFQQKFISDAVQTAGILGKISARSTTIAKLSGRNAPALTSAAEITTTVPMVLMKRQGADARIGDLEMEPVPAKLSS